MIKHKYFRTGIGKDKHSAEAAFNAWKVGAGLEDPDIDRQARTGIANAIQDEVDKISRKWEGSQIWTLQAPRTAAAPSKKAKNH